MTERNLILKKSKGHCWYCGTSLQDMKWKKDHFYPIGSGDGKVVYPELDAMDNLVPCCTPCYNFKSASSIQEFRHKINENFLSYGIEQLTAKFWFEKQNISMPSESSLIGVSEEAEAIIWSKDNSEPDYFYTELDGFLCSLRRMSDYWLVIAINYDWLELGRCELPNGRLVKEQAAEWALRVNSKQMV